MEFKDFAALLHSVLGGDDQGTFVRELFMQITVFPEEQIDSNVVMEQSSNTFKDYFRGRRKIGVFAKKILPNINPEFFRQYIEGLGDTVIDNLVEVFEDVCPEIDSDNAAYMLSDLFKKIIFDAAAGKSTSQTKQKNEGKCFTDIDAQLYLETSGKCPYNGCGIALKESISGKVELLYDVVRINEHKNADYENLLMVCPKCAHIIKTHHTEAMTERLRQIKKELTEAEEISAILVSEVLDNQIKSVLTKIKTADEEELIELNYNPVSIREKIPKENNALYFKIRGFVMSYFFKIDEWLKEMDQDGSTHYSTLCSNIKICWIKLRLRNISQTEAFSYLTDWMIEKTGEDRTPCEAVISYFVQKCEVFDAITE